MEQSNSKRIFDEATSLFVGGVNSPVRAFGSVGGSPIVPERGAGAWITDADGNRFIDYVLSWGPLVLGHAHPRVVEAVTEAVAKGTSFGMPTAAENRLGVQIRQLFPELERMRLVNSGTEATMSALRLARGITGRSKVVKFVGCYHGHVDSLLVEAGSGLATFGTPSSPGISAATAGETLALPFNDAEALREAFAQHGDSIAAVILETIPCNAGMVFPDPDFLTALQELAKSNGALVIADEVLTGLRAARGGAYHRHGLKPDLVCVGKVVGGGFPLAAYGGSKELMAHLSPDGPVYQAGTLSGNPVAATAGAATLSVLLEDDPFAELEGRTAALAAGIKEAAREAGIPMVATTAGSILGLCFRETPPRNFADVQDAAPGRYAKLFWGLMERGVCLAPSSFEVGFLSTAHGDAEIDRTLEAVREVFREGLDSIVVPA